MAAKRIFIAFDISDDARSAAAEYTERLRSEFPRCPAAWTKPEKLHFTLRFLGDLELPRIQVVGEAAEFAASESKTAELRLEGTGVFPSPRKARVLWLGAKGDLETIAELKMNIDERLKRAGFAEDQKRFTPHLTLARIKDPNACRQLVDDHLNTPFHTAPFTISEVVIYESELHRNGSVYTALERFKLK